MRYRPDIDGLRAIAVLLVLSYHGHFGVFPSGFIGVDVFFVISGFLITSLILTAMQQKTFSLVYFYNRRLWRLQPVFIALLVATSLMTLFFYLPDDLMHYMGSARKASLFFANGYFNRTTTGYFSPDLTQLPLLHTWSLSIEWQCYLLLPLLLVLLYRWSSQRLFGYLLMGLMIASFCWTLYTSNHDSAGTYYRLSSRWFEFLLGACVVLYGVRVPEQSRASSIVWNTSAALALFVLGWVATRTQIMLGYPNGYALLTCGATALLLALGQSRPHLLFVRLLSWKPLVFIGLLSYSLYIWHWVILSFMRYQSIDETPLVLMGAFGLIVLLAYGSWRWIEKPTRRLHRLPIQYALVSLIALPIATIHLSAYLIKYQQGFPARFNSELVTIYQRLDKEEHSSRYSCIDKPGVLEKKECLIGSHAPDAKKGLLIGDSYSNHYWGFMDTLGQASGISIRSAATSSCLTLPGIDLFDWWHFKDRIDPDCHRETARYFEWIKNNHYDYVMIGENWLNYLGDHIIEHVGDARSWAHSQRRLQAALNRAFDQIIASGAVPVLIKATASTKNNVRQCFFKHIKRHVPYDPKICDFTVVAQAREQWLNQVIVQLQKQCPSLIVIDPKKAQCPDGLCRAAIRGVPVFRDLGHITDYASYALGDYYLEHFKNPLSNEHDSNPLNHAVTNVAWHENK